MAITCGPFAVFKDAVGDQVNVLAPLAFNVADVPAQNVVDKTVIVGFGMAFNVNVAKLVQVPFAPITEPEIAAALLDVPMIDEPFKVFVVKPIIGPHVYDAAPAAFKVTVFGEPLKLFIHKVGLLGVTVTDGKPNTETVIAATCVHVACEPKTEYVVVIVGLAVVLGPNVVVNAMFGDHV